jgi:hypothetical protein
LSPSANVGKAKSVGVVSAIVGATMTPVTVTVPDEVRGTEADTAMGTTKAAINAKTVTKAKIFFIYSPNIFLFSLFYFSASLDIALLFLLIGPIFLFRFKVVPTQGR